MVDDDGTRAALGLRSLAGVVDDEGIELRQGTQRDLGQAFGRERIGLARQPFEIAVLAVVNNGMGLEVMAEPEIEGQIAVRGEQGRVVIGGFRIDVVAARRLDRHGGIAVEADGEVEGAIGEEGVGGGITPAFGDPCTDGVRQSGEMLRVICKRKGCPGQARRR